MSHAYVYIRTHIYTYMRYISTKPLSKKELRQGHFLQGHGAAEEGHHPQVGQGACSGQVFAVFFWYVNSLTVLHTITIFVWDIVKDFETWITFLQDVRIILGCITIITSCRAELARCPESTRSVQDKCFSAPRPIGGMPRLWEGPLGRSKNCIHKLGKSLDLSILKALFDRGIQCTMQGIHSGSPLKATLGIAVETSQFNRYNTWLAARHPNLPAKSLANGGVSIAMLEASSIDRNMSTRIFAFLRYII